MMNEKLLFSIPMITMGLVMIILGARWMIVDEPWMLDQVANEERLDMSFDELFEPNINENLPGYLRQIYRFFGLWVITIGMFIALFSRPKIIENNNIRLILLFCVGLMIYSTLILSYILIPSSPFIYLGWAMLITHSFSVFSHIKI